MTLLDKIRGANSGDDIQVEFSDDIRDEMAQDPTPGKPARSGAEKPARTPTRRVSHTVRKQLADEIEAYLLLGSGAWQMRDPYCGEALEKQAKEIALRLAAILGRNAKIVEWLHTTGAIGEWVALAMACKPVIDAFRDHHVTKKVTTDDSADPYAGDWPAYQPAT